MGHAFIYCEKAGVGSCFRGRISVACRCPQKGLCVMLMPCWCSRIFLSACHPKMKDCLQHGLACFVASIRVFFFDPVGLEAIGIAINSAGAASLHGQNKNTCVVTTSQVVSSTQGHRCSLSCVNRVSNFNSQREGTLIGSLISSVLRSQAGPLLGREITKEDSAEEVSGKPPPLLICLEYPLLGSQ